MRILGVSSLFIAVALGCGLLSGYASKAEPQGEETGKSGSSVFGDWHQDRPGLRRRITIGDLPPPYATPSVSKIPHQMKHPAEAPLRAPDGFKVNLFAEGLDQPRTMRVAPNGDIFLAETAPGNVRVLRPTADGSAAAKIATYASGLSAPFGIAFYPAGPAPKWIYVAEENRVVRFPYSNGDLAPKAAPEVVVARLASTTGGHVTRDIAFSKDGARMYVSVGSESNVAEGMARKSPQAIRAWEAVHGFGSAWGDEESRANVLSFTPEGKERRVFATGIRNCVALAVHPETGDVYCATNERDGLGDNLVPDYVTHIRAGEFFGWPWHYMGGHEDPRWRGARPDLAGKVTNPDVLIQPHSAPLGLTFYTGTAFPVDYRGSAFAAFHGSWNRSVLTGYKVVRILMQDGHPTGDYEDFLTGFVASDDLVWGRPVSVTVAGDGSLLVSEDANGTIWRVSAAQGR